MNWLIGLTALFGFGALGIWYFVTASPAALARALRYALPVLLAVVGGVLSVAGRVGIGAPLIMFAFALFARARRAGGVQTMGAQRSTVRSAMLEMALDHETGEMDGLVLGGQFEGAQLNVMTEEQLMALAAEISDDAESAQLLEAYLDRRVPGWRDGLDTDAGAGRSGAAQSGAMTEQDAYQILGLEPGASLADIRKAHRSLMQRVHPDVGGSAFLAQRINEAKDFLLAVHKKQS